MKFYLFIAALIVTGCSDASLGKLTSLGSSASVICRSGGIVFLNTKSTGKVYSEKNSDGYYFTEEGTGDSIEVSGDCIIRVSK